MSGRQKKFTKNEFEKSLRVFEKKLYSDKEKEGVIHKRIEKAFKTANSKHHNCLGDNLDETTHHIYMFLYQEEGHLDLTISYTTYFMLLYLTVERIEVIFDIIGLPEEYKQKHFKVFQKIKKWANFIKHPKAFVLSHDPYYVLENDLELNKVKDEPRVFIDNNFVFKYYSGKNNNADLYKKLANKSNVVVVIPNIVILTTEFCEGILCFLNLLEKNEVYREILNDKTTIRNYFVTDI